MLVWGGGAERERERERETPFFSHLEFQTLVKLELIMALCKYI